MDNCCCSSCDSTKTYKCPVCGALGQSVPIATVKSLVKDSAKTDLKDDNFGICLTPECDVVYFGQDTCIRQKDVVVPVSYKTGASPKFVCYCNRVTEEEIVRAVVDGGARTIGDVARLTGAMKNGRCLTTNPKGVCCHKDIETIIQKAINRI